MLINSEYDSYATTYNLQIPCLTKGKSGYSLSSCTTDQMTYIEKYRTEYRTFLYHFMINNPKLSFWSVACSNHVYAYYDAFYNNPLEKIPTKSGKTVKDAIDEFVFENKVNQVYDKNGWPSN